ncbi:sulfatase [Actinoplanes sp. TRM88002]|uniref:Sulfatase n=1 Tax=Paractinoplanes hotanensis TaxID=2906497 RepID=A0ABT0YCL0_9ACTN|nr:sulfatase [Actinoplanes hotanensis]
MRADVAFSGKLPGVERLRQQGTTFREAVSSCPLTPVSHATVFTGLQPTRHGVRHLFREQLRTDVPTLAECLRAAGYATGAVVSCPGLDAWYGINRGFDLYDYEIPLLPDGRDPLRVNDVKLRGLALKRAPVVVERASAWLAEQTRPFFLFAHFFDAHWPYEPPEDVGVPVDNPYEGEVAYSDFYLQRLLDTVQGMGTSPDSLLTVCFSDHGEDLGGWYPNDHANGRGYPYEEGHGCLLFDATQHVPLIMSGHGVPVGREVHQQVRLVDILPTVLDLLGLDTPASDGASLTEFFGGGGRSRPAYSETHFPEELAASSGYSGLSPLASVRMRDDAGARTKLVWQLGGSGVTFYDLAADPNEEHGVPMTGCPATSPVDTVVRTEPTVAAAPGPTE